DRHAPSVRQRCVSVGGNHDRKERTMLFHVAWESIAVPEESQKRSLEFFSKWQPPAGADFSKGFYGFADGSGGVAIVEVDSAADISRTTDTSTTSLRFPG